jgi:hypothetical protein
LPWIVLVVVGVLAAACSSPERDSIRSVRRGDALAETSPDSLEMITLPPGQEVIQLGAGLRNASSSALEITKLRPAETEGVPDVAQIARVALVDRASIDVAGGTFVTFPPVARRGGVCVRSKVFPARGATIEPDEAPLILVLIRAIAAGRATIPAFTVSYEQDGDLFKQTIRSDGAAVFTVADDAEALKPSPDERACASRVQLLPGAVHI